MPPPFDRLSGRERLDDPGYDISGRDPRARAPGFDELQRREHARMQDPGFDVMQRLERSRTRDSESDAGRELGSRSPEQRSGDLDREIKELQREIARITYRGITPPFSDLPRNPLTPLFGGQQPPAAPGEPPPVNCEPEVRIAAAPSCEPPSGLTVNGNTVNTGRYTIVASNGGGGTLTVTDNVTGKSFKCWGDPHVTTDKNDTANFQHQPVTFKLDDGAKITIDPTNNPTGPNNPNGVEYIGRVAITKGNDAVEMSGFQGTVRTQFEPGMGRAVDAQYADGTVLRPTNGQIDQLHVVGGPAISGNNSVDLDNYATASWPNESHAGQPPWRHDHLKELTAKLQSLRGLRELQERDAVRDRPRYDEP